MKKFTVLLLAVVLCLSLVACGNPIAKLGEIEYVASFDSVTEQSQGEGGSGWQTICFGRDWENGTYGEFEADNLEVVEADGIEGMALEAGIKLPDPSNVWYALGMNFTPEYTYEGNFVDMNKIAFKYISNVDYSEIVANEDANIYVQIAIKSVAKDAEGEQESFEITTDFPMINTDGEVAVFEMDVPTDVQTKIAAYDGELYFDWMMFAIEDAGDNFMPGKITLGEISFLSEK